VISFLEPKDVLVERSRAPAAVEKTAALSTELRGATAKGSAPRPEKMGLKSCSPSAIVVK